VDRAFEDHRDRPQFLTSLTGAIEPAAGAATIDAAGDLSFRFACCNLLLGISNASRSFPRFVVVIQNRSEPRDQRK